ncbi:unnamed protein product [Ectocarpus sp. 12 AP-2014]
MDQWHARAASHGAARAFLEVADDNFAALELYATCRYVQVGRRKGYYPRPGGAPADALIMCREIVG